MIFEGVVKPTWLIHFTDDPDGIAMNGFKYGHEEFRGLHLTTYKGDRMKFPGYNFYFDTDNERDYRSTARQGKYGKHAVVFWGSGVEAWHSGDEERQVVFWGPSVRKDMIFPVKNDYGDWTVFGWNDRELYKSESIEDAVNWIINNYRMLQSIRDKQNRPAA